MNDPFELARRVIRGEVSVDEFLCASRPTQPKSPPKNSPLAAALKAVEDGDDGDGSLLVTPPYRIFKYGREKRERVTRRPPKEGPDYYHHEKTPPLDAGIDRSLPKGDREL